MTEKTSATNQSMTMSATTLYSFLVCVLYGLVSISITFFNKAVLSSYAFHSPNMMTLFQLLFSWACLVIMKSMNRITYAPLQYNTAKNVFPLSLSFFGMVLTGLAALNYLNIPMFNSLRRFTTLLTMGGEYYWMHKSSSFLVQLSVYGMVLGAVVAGIYDFDFSFIGYVLVTLNCVFTAGYLLCIAQFYKMGLNTMTLMYYNTIQSLPLVILLCYFNGDFEYLFSYPLLYDIGFWICFIFQSGLAFLLNYTIFLCTQTNSALATSVTGQIKNILTTAVGYFLFGDVTYNIVNVIGLVIGIITSGWYSWLKYLESEQKKPKSDTLLPVHENNSSEKDIELGKLNSRSN